MFFFSSVSWEDELELCLSMRSKGLSVCIRKSYQLSKLVSQYATR